MSTSVSSSSELLVARGRSALGAICAPRGGITETDKQRLLGSVGPDAAMQECSTRSGRAVWLFGRLDDIDLLAVEVGLPSSTPAERIVLVAWRRFGDALFPRLRGPFLLVLWQPEDGAAVIVVDHLGSCSPHVRPDDGKFYVATSAQLLRQMCARPLEPDDVGVVRWLAGDVPPLGATLFAGVERPLGGTYLTIAPRGRRTTTYWRPRYHEPPGLNANEASSLMWQALRTSVRRRLVGVQRAGVIMSGGVDSTSVAAAATTLAGDAPYAYSAVFPGHRVDESERIDAVVDALDLGNVQVAIEPAGAFALSLDYLERWAVPANGAGYLVEYPLLTEAAADGVTVVLDGQGGDELFAVSGFLLADRVAHGRLVSSFRLARRLPGGRGRSPQEILEAWRYYVQGGAVPYGLHSALKRGRGRRGIGGGWLTAASEQLLIETDHSFEWKRVLDGPRWWAHKAHLLTRSRELVRISDYLRERALAAGLEAAPPLFDVDLVETALGIPPEIEFDPDVDRPLIRRATDGIIPDRVRLSVEKSNLAPFYIEVVSGRDLGVARAVLTASNPRIGRYVDESAVRQLLDRVPQTADRPAWRWQAEIWRLVTVECWLRYLESPSSIATLFEHVPIERPAWTIHRRRSAG